MPHAIRHTSGLITEAGSPIAALVLETNEELVVARETMSVVSSIS